MSWLARSLAKSLLADDDDEVDIANPTTTTTDSSSSSSSSPTTTTSSARGVKEDLTELTETFTRRFHGFASFLAPPPQNPIPNPNTDDDSDRIQNIHNNNDLAEIRDKLRAGLSKISAHKAVSEFAKIASSLVTSGGGAHDDEEEVVGVSEEVVGFVKDVAMHPEMWLDFPLLPDEEGFDDFDMSDAQQSHALAVESLAPELADLRIELCPSHMSEGYFWKIYFVLLHPRLNKEDAQLLSTPLIVEARERLLETLKSQKQETYVTWVPLSLSKVEDIVPPTLELMAASDKNDEKAVTVSFSKFDDFTPTPLQLIAASKDTDGATESKSTGNINDGVPTPVQLKSVLEGSNVVSVCKTEEVTNTICVTNLESEKQTDKAMEVEVVEKHVIEKEQLTKPQLNLSEDSRIIIQKADEDGDEWLEEETGVPGSSSIPTGDDEEVSFSDLEEDDDTR